MGARPSLASNPLGAHLPGEKGGLSCHFVDLSLSWPWPCLPMSLWAEPSSACPPRETSPLEARALQRLPAATGQAPAHCLSFLYACFPATYALAEIQNSKGVQISSPMAVGKHLGGRSQLYFSRKESAAKPSPAIPSEEVELHVAFSSDAQVGTNSAACSQLSCTASRQAHLPWVRVGAPSLLEAHGNLSLLPRSSGCCIHHPKLDETRSTINARRAREASTHQTARRAFRAVPAGTLAPSGSVPPTCPTLPLPHMSTLQKAVHMWRTSPQCRL